MSRLCLIKHQLGVVATLLNKVVLIFPHHDDIHSEGTAELMASSAHRPFEAVGFYASCASAGKWVILVLVQGWWPDGGGSGVLPRQRR